MGSLWRTPRRWRALAVIRIESRTRQMKRRAENEKAVLGAPDVDGVVLVIKEGIWGQRCLLNRADGDKAEGKEAATARGSKRKIVVVQTIGAFIESLPPWKQLNFVTKLLEFGGTGDDSRSILPPEITWNGVSDLDVILDEIRASLEIMNPGKNLQQKHVEEEKESSDFKSQLQL
ncbi:hypothetical protein PIB30_071663 [Stylosanthes scabra]|uniref:Uncharacterized protein n=1 Tax=Stylosanthes scabra TaxID=79078 RepID=A0ABU6RQ16_9FABA|nr:hypothetical protein [Stylosanthes scabra]